LNPQVLCRINSSPLLTPVLGQQNRLHTLPILVEVLVTPLGLFISNKLSLYFNKVKVLAAYSIVFYNNYKYRFMY
jgi:hypothetical protein